MMKFQKKEKIFQKKQENFGLNINLYWKFAVCFLFAAMIFSFIFGYQLFARMNSGFVMLMENESRAVETVKKDRIDKVLEYFSEREKKSNEIVNFPAPVVDPSL